MRDLDRNRAEYWDKGYTVLRGLYSEEEVAQYRAECDRLWELDGLDDDLNLRTEFRRSGDEFVFDRLDPVLDISPTLNGAATHALLMEALKTVLGGDAKLLKCKLIQKAPRVNGYAAHQDFLYWTWLDMDPDALCTVVVNLYPSDARSGGIGFYPHQHGALVPGPPDNPEGDCDVSRLDPETVEFPALEAGDVLVFHSLVPHFSGRNEAEVPRTVLLPSYAVTEDDALYQRYYQREVVRRCRELVGFERYFERNATVAG